MGKNKIIFENLIPYGFNKANNEYVFTKNILNNTFQIIISIDLSGKVTSKIYDLEFNEEYDNYKVNSQNGEFVGKIRDNLANILKDIKKHCTSSQMFYYAQTNRIAKYIINKFNSYPEFMWEKFPDFGIFRNSNNHKWFGIIMKIEKNKINSENGNIEIINLKVKNIDNLLHQKGFYPAYHMNKKYWITIILDDTIKDEDIIKYIDESYELVNN